MKNITEGKIIKEVYPVKLTEEEMIKKAIEAAKDSSQRGKEELEIKRLRSEFKGRIDELAGNIHQRLLAIELGEEDRPIDVQWKFYWKEGRKDLIRLDTNEVVKTEKLTDEDRQLSLADGAKTKTKKAAFIDGKMKAANDK